MKNIYQKDIHFRLGYFADSFPVPHPALEDYWLMPAKFEGNEWKLFVGKNYFRIFKQENLHSELKVQYCFIQAMSQKYIKDIDLIGEIQLFIPPSPDHELDTGWRVSESWFTFIIPENLLLYLRGETNFIKYLKEKL